MNSRFDNSLFNLSMIDVNVPIPIMQYIQHGISATRKNRLNGCFRIWPQQHIADTAKQEKWSKFCIADDYQK